MCASACADLVGEDFRGYALAPVDAGSPPPRPPPSAFWPRVVGGDGFDAVTAIALDAEGSVYIAGHFSQRIDFAPGVSLTASEFDGFVARYSATGEFQWVQRFGGEVGFAFIGDVSTALAVDDESNVYVTGAFGTPFADFGGGPLVTEGLFDAFVVSYSGLSTFRWAHAIRGGGWDEGRAIAVVGNHLVVGGLTARQDALRAQLFVSRHDLSTGDQVPADGDFLESGSGFALGVAAAAGEFCVGGCFEGAVTLGGKMLDSVGTGPDSFLVCFDDASTAQTVAVVGEADFDCLTSLAMSKPGFATAVGNARSNDQQDLYVLGAIDVSPSSSVIGRVSIDDLTSSASTRFSWVERIRTGVPTGDPTDAQTAVDVDGNVFVVAPFMGQIEVAGSVLSSRGGRDVLVASWTADGELRWATSLGGPFRDDASSIALGQDGSLFIGGSFTSTARYQGAAFSGGGATDGLILRIDGASGALE